MPPSAGAITASLSTLPVRIRIAGTKTRTWWNSNTLGLLRSTDVCAFLPGEHNLITTGGGITRGRVAWNWHNWMTGDGTNGGATDKTWDAQDEIAGVPITQLDVALYNTEKPLTNPNEWDITGVKMPPIVTQALKDAKTSGHGGLTRTGFDFWWGPDESLFNIGQSAILTQGLTALYLQGQAWQQEYTLNPPYPGFDSNMGRMFDHARATNPTLPIGMQVSFSAPKGFDLAGAKACVTHAMAFLNPGSFPTALQIVGIFPNEDDVDVVHGGNGNLDAMMQFLRPGGATSYSAEEDALDKNKATLAEQTARARSYAFVGHNLPSLRAVATLAKAQAAHDTNVASLVAALQSGTTYLRNQTEVEANIASFVRQLQLSRSEVAADLNVATVAEVLTQAPEAPVVAGAGSPYVANVSTPSGSPYVAR